MPLDRKKIYRFLNEGTKERVDHHAIEIFDVIDSTNLYLKNNLSASDGVRICLAEAQTNGKGRMDRRWHSPYAENLYFTLAYPISKKVSALSGLSLVVGLAVAEAIEASVVLPEKIRLKWPNDLKVNHEKLAGNLLEIKTHAPESSHLIIGVGVNVNMSQASHVEVNQPWCSIRSVTQKILDRNVLCAKLIEFLISFVQKFMRRGFSVFWSEWKERDDLAGREIKVVENRQVHQGVGVGVDSAGRLVLRLKGGALKSFLSGKILTS